MHEDLSDRAIVHITLSISSVAGQRVLVYWKKLSYSFSSVRPVGSLLLRRHNIFGFVANSFNPFAPFQIFPMSVW